MEVEPVDPLAPEPKKGFLARLFGGSKSRTFTKTVVHRKEQLNLVVPADHADALQDAVQRWLQGRGIEAEVTREDAGEGKTRLRTSLGDEDSAKLDLSDDKVQNELQNLLADSIK